MRGSQHIKRNSIRTVGTKHILNFETLVGDETITYADVDYAGAFLVLSQKPAAEDSGTHQHSLRICDLRSDEVVRIQLPPSRYKYFTPQKLDSNHWVVQQWSCEGSLIVVDSEGAITERIAIQHFAQHVQVTEDGQIWLGYGDEMVFERDADYARSGVVALDRTGKLVFRLSDLEGMRNFTESYAMNIISSDEAWLYYLSMG